MRLRVVNATENLPIPARQNGTLVSQVSGKAVGYALWKLQERAEMFVKPGDDVYEGMIIGIKLRNYKKDLDDIRKKLYKAEDEFAV